MPLTTSAPRRRVAAGLAGALVAGLSAAAAVVVPAQAAPVAPAAAPSLTWSISDQFLANMPASALSGGAGFDATARTYSFPGLRTVVQADGDVQRFYGGSVTGTAPVTRGGYSVTLSEPVFTLETDGSGSLQATVSSSVPGEATEAPEQVTVVRFAATASTTASSTTVVPLWAGELPPGSPEALALGLAVDRPVDGKSFHPEFIAALNPGVRAHFLATSATSDAKRPGTVVAGDVPTVAASVTATSATDGVTVKVVGTDFNAVTNPGDAGVYVGIAPAALAIDFDDRSSTSKFAAVDYVTPARFVRDGFVSVLTAPVDKLVKGTEYAVFTWQAHTHSTTSQDTRTAFAIDWSLLAAPVAPAPSTAPATPTTPATPIVTPIPAAPAAPTVVKAAAKVRVQLRKPSTGTRGRAVVRIAGATGKVKATLKVPGRKKAVRIETRLNGEGRAVLRLPRAVAGRYKLVVRYLGDDAHTAKRKVTRFRVR